MNSMPIPITEIIAPNISFGFTFSLKTNTEKGIIVTGIIEVIVDEIPALVYCNDTRDRVTPIKGPKKEPRAIAPIAFLFLNAIFRSPNFFVIINKMVKLINPEIIRI